MKSSIASLMIETARTKTRGAIAVPGLRGEIILMDWMIAMMRK